MATSFSKAVSRLTLTDMFFTALLYNLKHVEDDKFPACAGTDGVRLIWNPTLFDTFSTIEGRFVLAHEIMHVILYHTTRRGARDPKIWNYACDYAANLILKQHGLTPCLNCLCDDKYIGMSAEKIYDELIKSGMKPPDSSNPLLGDVMDYKPGENGNVSAQEVEREIGIGLEKALQVAKAAGQLTAEQRQQLRDAQVEKEPWHVHLRRYISVLNTREYNWSRVDQRRMSYTSIVMPECRTEAMGKIVLSIDESGSLSNDMLSAIAAHVSDLCKSCNPKEVVIIRHTDRVTHVESYTGPEYGIELVRKSTGGTDFRPVFDLIEAEHSDAQVTLMFTDMYGDMPDNFAGDVLWISSTKGQNPNFGEIIEADFNE